MAKLSKEELLTKVEATGMSDEEKISFMEDISDSFEVPDTTEVDNLKSEVEMKQAEIDDLRAKYKARFLSNDEVKETKEEPKEMEQKEVIDVKDIFEEREDED